MSGFNPDWLRLRASFDDAARSKNLLRRFVEGLPRPVRLVDLGAGTGATLRAIAPVIGGEQAWVLIDHDAALLDAVGQEMTYFGWKLERFGDGMEFSKAGCHVHVTLRQADLAAEIEKLDLAKADAVVASALLDLVSAEWGRLLVGHCATYGVPLYAALSFDGHMSWAPADPRDDLVRQAFLDHQRRDKGFGPALGPEAAHLMMSQFERLGFDVALVKSDWHIGPQDMAMHKAFLAGIVSAVIEQAPLSRDNIKDWAEMRGRQIESGMVDATVGHLDLLAYPPSFRRA